MKKNAALSILSLLTIIHTFVAGRHYNLKRNHIMGVGIMGSKASTHAYM